MASRIRGQSGRDRRRLPDLSVRPEDDAFIPYRDNAVLRQFSVALNQELDRLVIREWRDQQSGALSDFVVSQQAFDSDSGKLSDVALVDAKHGSVHIHRYRKSGTEISRTEISAYSTREQVRGHLQGYL